MNGPASTVSSIAAIPATATRGSQFAGRYRCAQTKVVAASARPIAANMTIEARFSAAALSWKPKRITSRATTLITKSPSASAATGAHRFWVTASSNKDLGRFRAADEPGLGIVLPGELLPLHLLAILADDAPRILGEAWESGRLDALRARLAVDGLRRGDVAARAAHGLDAVVVLRAPHRHGHRPAGARRVDQDAVRRGVLELEIERRVEDRRLDHRRVPGEVERVRLVLDVLQARVVRRVEQRGGELRRPAADARFQLAVHDHRCVLVTVGVVAFAGVPVQRERLAR